MVDRTERDNGLASPVELESAAPRCALASRLAVVAAHEGAAAVTVAALANADVGELAALCGAAKWLDAKPVRKDLDLFGKRIAQIVDVAAHRHAERIAAFDEVMTHTRELLVVAFASGYGSGHAAGHKLGRGVASTEEQVKHLSQAERQNYQAMQTRDAWIREELAALIGLLDMSVAGSKIVPSWEKLLAALDTMKTAARMVAHMFGGAK